MPAREQFPFFDFIIVEFLSNGNSGISCSTNPEAKAIIFLFFIIY